MRDASPGTRSPAPRESAIGRLGQAAVGVHDRVPRVLPALVARARLASASGTRRSRRRPGRRSGRSSPARRSTLGSSSSASARSPVQRKYCANSRTNSGVASTRAVVRRVRDQRRRRRARRGGSRAGSCPAPRRARGRPRVPWWLARSSSVSRARPGFTVSSWWAAISASRPNRATYQGMPAARICPPSDRVYRARRSREPAVEQAVEQLVVGDDLRGLALPVLVGAAQARAPRRRSRRSRLGSSPTPVDGQGDEPRLVRRQVQPEVDA